MNQPSRAEVQDSLKQAQMSFNQGNFSVAEPIYKQLLDSIPQESEEYALCLHNLGEINEQRGNLTTAIWWQTRLLSHPLMTDDGMVHHLFSRMSHIAALYTKAGRPSEASQTYQQMAILQPRMQSHSPDGFTPQTEIGTFLRGVLDQAHRKFSSDAAETQQTNEALQQIQPHAGIAPAPAAAADQGIPEALRPFQTHAALPAAQDMGHANSSAARGFDPAQLDAIPPPGMSQAPRTFSAADIEAISTPGNAATNRGFSAADLDSIGRKTVQTGSSDVNTSGDNNDTNPRGMRRVGIGEVEKAPSEMDALMEGLANLWVQLTNSKWAGIAFLGTVGVVLFIVFHLPYSGNPTASFKSMPSEYATIDGSSSLYLRDMNTVEFRTGKEKSDFPYKFYYGDPREAIFLSAEQLPEKQYWLTDTRDEKGTAIALVDDKGLSFYSTRGPESQLYAAMKQISDVVSAFYNSHTSTYPASNSDFTGGELSYHNPFTNAMETATVQAILVDAATKKGVQALSDFYDKLAQGKGWDKQPEAKPGSIQCCAATLNTSGGPVHVFAIIAAGRQGKPILGPTGQSFYMALEEGKPHEIAISAPAFLADSTFRKRIIVFLEKPIDSNLAFVVHGVACWLFTILAFICGCVLLSLPKRSPEKPLTIIFIVLFGIGAILYTICNRF